MYFLLSIKESFKIVEVSICFVVEFQHKYLWKVIRHTTGVPVISGPPIA